MRNSIKKFCVQNRDIEEDKMVFILENLAVGNFSDAKSLPPEITAFLNVAEELDLELQDKLYHKVPLKDFSPIPEEKLREAIDWIRENISKHKVLVFCNAGVGRSPSVVVSYLCSKGLKFGEAVEFVASKKPNISILPGLFETIKRIQ